MNLSLSGAIGETAEVGTALCKTPTSVCRDTQQRLETEPRRPGDPVDNHRIRLLTICGSADAG